MIIITNVENSKKYEIPEMPNFQNRRAMVMWLRTQKMIESVSNIESVSVQVKDIKKMVYSKNPSLVSLYTNFRLFNEISSYNNEDYITISKSNDLNKTLIYSLINADWLLNVEDLNNKSTEELKQEYIDLQNKINLMKQRKKQFMTNNDIGSKIKLFEYKLTSLSEFILNKENLKSDLNDKTTKIKLFEYKLTYSSDSTLNEENLNNKI